MFDLTLTFDNGPEPGVTPRVLDILREARHQDDLLRDRREAGDPERRRLAARAHDEGHWIGNHTFTHSVPLGQQRDPETARTRDRPDAGRDRRPRASQIAGSGRSAAAAISTTRLLKPSVVEYLTRNKHSCVLWNAIPRDWDDPDGWVDRALAQCRSQPWSLMVAARSAERRDAPSRRLHRPRHQGRRALPPGLSCPIACRSVRARSCFPSNPMYPPSKKALTHEDREFQGRSDATYGLVTNAGIIDAGKRLKDLPTLKSLLAQRVARCAEERCKANGRTTPSPKSSCCRRFPIPTRSSASASTTPRIWPKAAIPRRRIR